MDENLEDREAETPRRLPTTPPDLLNLLPSHECCGGSQLMEQSGQRLRGDAQEERCQEQLAAGEGLRCTGPDAPPESVKAARTGQSDEDWDWAGISSAHEASLRGAFRIGRAAEAEATLDDILTAHEAKLRELVDIALRSEMSVLRGSLAKVCFPRFQESDQELVAGPCWGSLHRHQGFQVASFEVEGFQRGAIIAAQGSNPRQDGCWDASLRLLQDTPTKFEQVYGVHLGHALWPLLGSLSHTAAIVYALCVQLPALERQFHKVTMASMCIDQVFAILWVASSVWACQSTVLSRMSTDLREVGGDLGVQSECCARSWQLVQCCVLWVLGPLYGFGQSLWLYVRFALFPDVPFMVNDELPLWLEALWYVCKVSSWLFWFFACMTVLGPAWIASRAAISNVIAKLNRVDSIDWDCLLAEVHELDDNLEKLWSLYEAGLPWLVLLVSTCATLAVNAFMAFSVDQATAATARGISLPASCALLVALLFALSTITSACRDTEAAADSIPAAAHRSYCSSWPQMTHEQRAAYHRFMSHGRANRMGVEICGVLVTYGLVVQLFFALSTAMPTILHVLFQLLDDPHATGSKGDVA